MSATELLTSILARTAAEASATTTIRETQREATSLPSLVTRYRHAWDLAAHDVLRTAVPRALPPGLAARVLHGPGVHRLAEALAGVTSRGADPVTVLRAAALFEDPSELDGARSPAHLLASRIQDTTDSLGLQRQAEGDRPLPWLPGARVGHPQWDDYLAARASLITARATRLGSVTAAYREQYRVTHLPVGQLGDLPPAGTAQETAYLAARREQQSRTGPRTPARRAAPPGPAYPDRQRPSRGLSM